MKNTKSEYDILEMISMYIIISLVSLVLGYIFSDIASTYNIIERYVYDNPMEEIRNVISFMLLKNNLGFFLVISLLPIINILLVITQFVKLGILAFNCKDMTFYMRFIILYRHTFFEIIALFVAIYVSCNIITYGKKYIETENSEEEDNYKKILYRIGISYTVVIIVTVIGAYLEGHVNV